MSIQIPLPSSEFTATIKFIITYGTYIADVVEYEILYNTARLKVAGVGFLKMNGSIMFTVH